MIIDLNILPVIDIDIEYNSMNCFFYSLWNFNKKSGVQYRDCSKWI